MRRWILYAVGLMFAGILAYYGGYQFYISSHPKAEIAEMESLQKGISVQHQPNERDQEYFVGKIEQNMLLIYRMPEKTVYDSVEVNSLNFYGDEEKQLMEGMVFQTLTEVFEFLENSMS